MKIIPVVLAGGIGERFWPASRSSSPKQVLPIISNKPMIEETLKRVSPFVKKGVKPLIVTGTKMAAQIKKALPESFKYDVIKEPEGKNTAPAVAAAAAFIEKRYGIDSVMAVLSADHLIRDLRAFHRNISDAAGISSEFKRLMIFGIEPVRADTGYGYIEAGKEIETGFSNTAFRVNRFTEKPSKARAEKYIASTRNYYWNSGIFVWSTSEILKEFEKYMPELFSELKKIRGKNLSQKSLKEFYLKSSKESIDYGILEHSSRTAVIKADFQWDDIGSWESIARISNNNDTNTIKGKKVYEEDCNDTIIANYSDRNTAVIGLSDTVVVTTDDSVLVIKKDRLPEIKEHLKKMKTTPGFQKKLF